MLGCIDSRVPIETVFDQGIGDISAARVARRESSVLAAMEQERKIRIVGGMYDVSTGVVRFL